MVRAVGQGGLDQGYSGPGCSVGQGELDQGSGSQSGRVAS